MHRAIDMWRELMDHPDGGSLLLLQFFYNTPKTFPPISTHY